MYLARSEREKEREREEIPKPIIFVILISNINL